MGQWLREKKKQIKRDKLPNNKIQTKKVIQR